MAVPYPAAVAAREANVLVKNAAVSLAQTAADPCDAPGVANACSEMHTVTRCDFDTNTATCSATSAPARVGGGGAGCTRGFSVGGGGGGGALFFTQRPNQRYAQRQHGRAERSRLREDKRVVAVGRGTSTTSTVRRVDRCLHQARNEIVRGEALRAVKCDEDAFECVGREKAAAKTAFCPFRIEHRGRCRRSSRRAVAAHNWPLER
jgi:hypothetical protein